MNTTFVFAGFVNGSIYALLALGILLMYQTTGVLNFAFGSFGMVAAYAFSSFDSGHAVFAAFVFTMILSVVVGMMLGVATLPAQTANPVIKAIACLGLLSALQGLVLVIWGSGLRETPQLTGATAFRAFEIAVTWQRLLAIVVAIAGSAAILLFLRLGPLGAALRAVATSTELSKLVGLPIRRLWITAWTLTTFVASLATILILPDVGLDPGNLTFIVLTPLAAVLAARFQSVPVALGVALALGVAQGVFKGTNGLAPYEGVLPFVFVIAALVAFRGPTTYERV